MLALLEIFAALACAQTAYSRITAEANFPTSSNGSSSFETGNSTAWASTNSSVSLTGGPAGWRIAGDSSSEVLYNFTESNNIASSNGDSDTYFDVVFTVNTTYGSTASSSLNLTTTPQLVPVTQTLLIKNLYCSSPQNFTAHIALTNGTTIRKTWINHLHLALPPGTANVTVNQIDLDNIANSEMVIHYGPGGLTASVPGGGGDAPSVQALSAATLKYCTDDD
ncbi:hypothetical protein FIBSPDRAFT_1048136 [Athelia psychrophila]|uniref:Uncharacterized protein n=1 Tax=Athelia psychrophila TaxID=1759441 RepID=A0A166E868_9AGAM|nr:hypothetical protein FIBSPDRAFT_1048136 [Fibularhizoctonia sp. CBS 109695]